MKVGFTGIDIENSERAAVEMVLNSGWLTTGPVTKEFEEKIKATVNADDVVCLNSATAAMELALRAADIGVGDEVIVPAYTFSATAAAVLHTGATVVMCDCPEGSFNIDANSIEKLISPRTKCIITVDIGGEMCDYQAIKKTAEKFQVCSRNPIFRALGRPIVMADAAHSFGASRGVKMSGEAADISCFSFHATKNITTAEGGAVAWKIKNLDHSQLKRTLNLLSLHGQTKTALDKLTGGYDYDVIFPGFKHNMTDLGAAVGLSQLSRMEKIIAWRKEIVNFYNQNINAAVEYLRHSDGSSHHLYMALLPVSLAAKRDYIIGELAKKGVSANVHYKPLPMLSAYKNLGFQEELFPNAVNFYRREISLPLSSVQSSEESIYVIRCFNSIVGGLIDTMFT